MLLVFTLFFAYAYIISNLFLLIIINRDTVRMTTTTNEYLRYLASEYALSYRDIARILEIPTHKVEGWMMKKGKAARIMPENALHKLMNLLKEK